MLLTSPSYHGLPWATAEPNFLHFLVKLGKPFTPKQKAGSARRVTRSPSYPVQLKTWSRRDDQNMPERCCWLGLRGQLSFLYTYTAPVIVHSAGRAILYPRMTFLFKTEASVQENRNLRTSLSPFFAPCPLNQGLCRIWGRHR